MARLAKDVWAGRGSESPRRVLSQSGQHLADVTMPGALRAFSITDDGVLGSTRGEYDEERIELWPFIDRPADRADPLPACAPSDE